MLEKPDEKKKTVTRSFRIGEESFNALEEDSLRHKVSLNTLVDQLFETHAMYVKFFERLGLLRISSATFRRILEAAPDEELAKAATSSARDTAKVVILAKYGELNLTSLLDYLYSMSEYGGWGEYNESESNSGKRVITFMHNYGQKGSIFLSNLIKFLFEEIGSEPKISTTEHAVVIEV
jgi:hypothetical protein